MISLKMQSRLSVEMLVSGLVYEGYTHIIKKVQEPDREGDCMMTQGQTR